MTTFPSEPSPDWGYKFENTPRVNVTQFGDGYTQRVPDGLNTMLRKTVLTYTDKFDNEKNTLVNFLSSLNGVDNFDWQPEGDLTSAKWYAPKWTVTPSAAGRWKITIEIEEDPAV